MQTRTFTLYGKLAWMDTDHYYDVRLSEGWTLFAGDNALEDSCFYDILLNVNTGEMRYTTIA